MGRKSFLKSSARTELFKNKPPDTPLPETPVITEKNLVKYYGVLCRTFEILCSVANKFYLG
jgi:hypothetical protein